MKYPINIEAFVAGFTKMYASEEGSETSAIVFRAMLPLVNEAYIQGVQDGRKAQV